MSGIDWLCPKTINMSLFGSPMSTSRTTFRIRIIPCNKAKLSGFPEDNVTCASDAEISAAVQNHFV